MDKSIRRIGSLALVALSASVLPVNAAFFQLAENSPAGLGNAFAGGAAIAEDASTVWYNPAGLTRLPGSQFVVGGHFIDPSTKFSKTSATSAVGGATLGDDNGGDAGESAFVPNFYYSRQLNDQLTFGFGVNVPFGLATDYDDRWAGRYYADRSEIKTVNLNPAVGYKFSEQLSVGGGFNIQRIEAELTQSVDFGSICTGLGAGGACGPAAQNDGHASVAADDTSYGFNLGALWAPEKTTRFGFAYRSKMDHKLEGSFNIQVPANVIAGVITGTGLVNSGAMAYVTLPDTLALSAFHQATQQWAIMGDITRTRWSRLPELRIIFNGTPVQKDSVTTLNLEDSNRYSIGAVHTPGGSWSYRAGIALDRTPTPDEVSRTPRLPDENRTWLSLGAGYKSSDKLSLDVAFTHIKIDDAKINKSAGTSSANENFFRGNLVGDYKASVNILSAQARWIY